MKSNNQDRRAVNRRFHGEQAAEWLIRLIAGSVFLYAGAIKAWNPAAFFADVENFHVVSGGLAAAVAFYLPWVEIVAAAAVLTRWQYRGGTLLLVVLTAAFAGLLASAWARGLDISCGCFGNGDDAVNYPLAMLRNVLLLAALGGLLVLDRRRQSCRNRSAID